MKTVLQSKSRLLDYFDDFTLQKGTRYFRDRRVLTFDAHGHYVEGMVKGSGRNVYHSQLHLKPDGSTVRATSCDCPVGYDCKHSAAVMIAFLNSPPEEFEFLDEQSEGDTEHKTSSNASPKSVEARLKEMLPRPDVQRALARLAATREIYAINDVEEVHVGFRDSGANYKPRSRVIYVLTTKIPRARNCQLEVNSMSSRAEFPAGHRHAMHPASLLSPSAPSYATLADVEIGELWMRMVGNSWQYSDNFSMTPPDLVSTLMTKVLKTGRCYYDGREGALKPGAPKPGELVWKKDSFGNFHICIVARSEERELPCLEWAQPWYVDDEEGTCGPVNLSVPSTLLPWIYSIRSISEKEAAGMPLLLADLGLSDVLPAPPCDKAVVVNLIPSTPVLKIVKSGIDGRQDLIASLSFQRCKQKMFEDSNACIVVEKPDLSQEYRAVERLLDAGMTMIDDPSRAQSSLSSSIAKTGSQSFSFHDSSKWLDFSLTQLQELRQQGWIIPAETEQLLTPVEITEENFDIAVDDDGGWWLSLALHINVEGKKVPLLPLLVSALRQLPPRRNIAESLEELNRDGKFYAVLKEGKLVSLPFDRIRGVMISLQEMIARAAGSDELKASVLHMTELLADESLFRSRWTGAERVIDLAARLRRLAQLEPATVPSQFQAELRPYQLDGLAWLQKIAAEKFGGILADDMGLGKTVQLLAHICLEKESGRMKAPYLVVCPTSVLPNWIAEAKKFAPQLKVLAYRGMDRSRHHDEFDEYDLIVTSYPLLTRDADAMQNRKWHGVALDEAQAIKNANTRTARAARGLSCEHRFCLTGTPVENHLGELWSHFQFLLPGLLGDQQTFNAALRHPIEKEGDLSRKEALAKRIRPFLLRRSKKEVAKELPERTVILKQVELEGSQRDLYETVRLASTKQVREEIEKKGFKQSQIMILDALLKLRQVCCDPRLVKMSAAAKAKESAKLEMLMEMLGQLIEDGRKILLFSQFTSMLDLISAELQANAIPYVQLRGDTKDRAAPVESFQNGDYPVFLISLKAGGVGLNLTAADVVIHYDPWWNPAVEEQATDRAHRIGQTKPVFVYKLIARGTIEQRMLELQDRKRSLAGTIYDERGHFDATFSEADLAALLNPIDEF